MGNITDGAQYTILVAEKWVAPADYISGTTSSTNPSSLGAGDSTGWDIGFSPNSARWANTAFPGSAADTSIGSAGGNTSLFGGPHSGSMNVFFCDGSVRKISFAMDNAVFATLCNRSDGKLMDDGVFSQ